MPRNTRKILAIDPGTRHMGVAFLDRGKLLYHGVKSIAVGRSPHETLREGRRLISRLLADLSPDVVVVEKTFFARSRNAALLNVFADEIKTIARRSGRPVIGYAPSTVKKFVTGDGHASKAEVARAIARWHPELRVFLTQDRAWKERYHQNMFDAVALGMMAELRIVDRTNPQLLGGHRRAGQET